VGETLQHLDFLDKIPTLATRSNNIIDSERVSSHAVGLLCTVAVHTEDEDESVLQQLVSEEIVKFVVTTMATYPNDVYMIDVACDYLDDISRLPEVKERLLKQGVLAHMTAAFQWFSNLDGALELDEEDRLRVEHIVKHSRQVLGRLIAI
jgi:hypothetical protein